MINQSSPLVSIITPVFNGAKYLPDLIKSIQCQSYQNVEHIIIDDGSTDDGATLKILKEYPHLRWQTRENKGQYATMNEGLQSANGSIVCFISADDILDVDAIIKAVNYLKNHPNHDGVYGTYKIIDEQGAAHWYQPLVRCAPINWYKYNPFIAHCSLYMLKETLISKNLYFDPSLRYTGDYDWIIRLVSAGLNIGFVSHNLSLIRWHEEQASNIKAGLIKQEMLKIWRKNKILPLIYKTINVMIDRMIVLQNLLASLNSPEKKKRTSEWVLRRKTR